MAWYRRLARAAIAVAGAVLCAGCSGINASKSVSPLDFLLPGLMYNCPATVPLPESPTNVPAASTVALAQ